MAVLTSALSRAARSAASRAWRLGPASAGLPAGVRTSEYVIVGGARRFRARQRRRTRQATRVGLLVIAAALAFDALALFDLRAVGHATQLAVVIDIADVG